jgi:hypothetical protein
MTLAGTVGRVTRRHGAAFTLHRKTLAAGATPWKPGAPTSQFEEVMAQERFYKPKEIVGTVQEGDVMVTVDAATCSLRPKVGDRVALGIHTAEAGAEWRQIVSVYEARKNGVTHAYKLQARR